MGIGELGWNWTAWIVGIILSLHHKGILSFISVSKAILANKIQLCYILWMVEPPEWVKRFNASIPQLISHQQLFTDGAGQTGINHFAPDKNNLTKLFASKLSYISIIFFPAFQIPNEFNFMEHSPFVEQTITSHFLSSCTQFWFYTILCHCYWF